MDVYFENKRTENNNKSLLNELLIKNSFPLSTYLLFKREKTLDLSISSILGEFNQFLIHVVLGFIIQRN